MNLQTTIDLCCSGTSEGVRKSWDTRGRGRADVPTKGLKTGQSTIDAWKNSKTGAFAKRRATYHESIVRSFLHGKTVPVGRKPTIWILGGGTASGKTTLKRVILSGNPNVVNVDPDEVKLSIPEYKKLKETDPMNATKRVHDESSLVTKTLLAEAGGKGLDIVYDSTTSGAVGKNIASVFRDRGYDVRVMFVDIPLAQAQERADLRARVSTDPVNYGRFVPSDIIAESHIGAAANFMDLKDVPGLTSKHFYDNQGKEPRLVYERSDNGEEKVHDEARWKQYQRKAQGDTLAASWAMGRPRARTFRVTTRHLGFTAYDERKESWQREARSQVELNY